MLTIFSAFATLSGTVNAETVRIDLSEFCSLGGKPILNQFEKFRHDSALWETQF